MGKQRKARRTVRGGHLRLWTGVRFVSRAPTRGGGHVRMRVTSLKPQHILWWQAEIQPVIDRDPSRPDHGWNWFLVAPFTFAAGTAVAHEPAGYALGMAGGRGGRRFIPCGLLTLVSRPRALDDHRRRGTFVWYLTTAPEAALRRLDDVEVDRDSMPKRLGQITLDVALCHSFNTGRKGRVALHASAEGGDALLAWYRRQGMRVLPASERLPEGFRQLVAPSDGRYCYFTTQDALRASQRLDPLRVREDD